MCHYQRSICVCNGKCFRSHSMQAVSLLLVLSVVMQKKLARMGLVIFKQKEHCTYLRCLTCYNPSMFTKTNKIPTKVGTSVRSRYRMKCNDLRDECSDCWTLCMQFNLVSCNTHKGSSPLSGQQTQDLLSLRCS